MVGVIVHSSEDLRPIRMDDTIVKHKKKKTNLDSNAILKNQKKKRKMDSNDISPEQKRKKLKMDSNGDKKTMDSPQHGSNKVGLSSSHHELILTSDQEMNRLKKKAKKEKKMKRKPKSSSKVFPSEHSSSSEEEKESLLAWVEMSLNGEEKETMESDKSQCEQITKRSKKKRKQSNGGKSVLTESLREMNAVEKTVDSDIQINVFEKAAESDIETNIAENIVAADLDKATTLLNSCVANDGNGSGYRSTDLQSSIELVNGVNAGHKKSNNSHRFMDVVNRSNGEHNQGKREDEKVRQYVMKRSVVIRPLQPKKLLSNSKTSKVLITAWDRTISVTVTRQASVIQEWISAQSGNVFGLDVEWRPNRSKSERNKVSLLQLCSENECLIVQMLFLDSKPPELEKLLLDQSKRLAGVGVLADCNRLQTDHGLACNGEIELTTLAVEQLKREELRHVGLKVLVNEVLGVQMQKPKRVTLSNWARQTLEFAQIEYACLDAYVSFAVCQKLLSVN